MVSTDGRIDINPDMEIRDGKPCQMGFSRSGRCKCFYGDGKGRGRGPTYLILDQELDSLDRRRGRLRDGSRDTTHCGPSQLPIYPHFAPHRYPTAIHRPRRATLSMAHMARGRRTQEVNDERRAAADTISSRSLICDGKLGRKCDPTAINHQQSSQDHSRARRAQQKHSPRPIEVFRTSTGAAMLC